ncbi:MAG: hypothetical protein QOD99_1441 [Chthoniobacter sp.]|jgi:hypothetical protein|nr:hypothetical protein [Chthoniobacter sp.]
MFHIAMSLIMKNARHLAVALALAAAAASLIVSHSKPELSALPEQSLEPSLPATSRPIPPAAEIPKDENEPHFGSARAEAQPIPPDPKSVPISKETAAKTPPAAKGKPPLQDPVARLALESVGTDPDAEEYWVAAINDSNLSPHERQDLIEDLNEEGFSDPENPTPEDRLLILRRLELIDALASDALDQVNFDAFNEAFKDLVNMLGRT